MMDDEADYASNCINNSNGVNSNFDFADFMIMDSGTNTTGEDEGSVSDLFNYDNFSFNSDFSSNSFKPQEHQMDHECQFFQNPNDFINSRPASPEQQQKRRKQQSFAINAKENPSSSLNFGIPSDIAVDSPKQASSSKTSSRQPRQVSPPKLPEQQQQQGKQHHHHRHHQEPVTPEDYAKYSEAVELLMHAPKLIQQFFNIGDFSKLNEFINDTCTDDCTLKTSAMQREETGKSRIMELFYSVSRAMPDTVLMAKSVKFHQDRGIITAKIFSVGTKQFNDPSEYLFNLAIFGPADNIQPAIRERAFSIQNRGKHYQITTVLTLHLILDPSFTKVRKAFLFQRPVEIKETEPIDESC